jgi:hypothetical protein
MIPTTRPASSTIAPVPDVDLKPTAEMAANAKRGLELRRQHGKGGTAVGVARARDLARRANLSPDTVRRMHSFFSRHEGNQAGGEDDAGYIAWLLWGGDAGKGWAERKTKELNKETAMRSDTYKAIASRLGMAARPGAKAKFDVGEVRRVVNEFIADLPASATRDALQRALFDYGDNSAAEARMLQQGNKADARRFNHEVGRANEIAVASWRRLGGDARMGELRAVLQKLGQMRFSRP